MDESAEELIHLLDVAEKHPERYVLELNGKCVSASEMRSEIVQDQTLVVSLDIDGLFEDFHRVEVVIERL